MKRKVASFTYKLSESYKLNNELQKAENEINNFMNDSENIDYGDRDSAMQIYAFHLKKIDIQMEG